MIIATPARSKENLSLSTNRKGELSVGCEHGAAGKSLLRGTILSARRHGIGAWRIRPDGPECTHSGDMRDAGVNRRIPPAVTHADLRLRG